MRKLRIFYLTDKDLRISTLKNIYQSILVIVIYNGIANRNDITQLELYFITIPIIVLAIYLSARLMRSVNNNIQKCHNQDNITTQLVEKEKRNSIFYLIISFAWILIFAIVYFATETKVYNLSTEVNSESKIIKLKNNVDSP